MARRLRPSPQAEILRYVEAHPEGVTRSQVAEAVGRTYWSARYWLEKKTEEELVRSERIWTIRHFVRRVIYYPVPTLLERLLEELRLLRKALEATERRLEVHATVSDLAYHRYLQREIARVEEEIRKLIPKWQLIDATIAIYSVVESPKGYVRRFQGFYDVDALRNADTGKFRYSVELTQNEINECLVDLRQRFGWRATGIPAPSTSVPVWIETSEFEFIDRPKGAVVKTLSVVEDEEETYFRALFETIYLPSESEIEEMMKLVS